MCADKDMIILKLLLCKSYLIHHQQSYSIVPDAGQPVSDEGECAHEEEEDCCAVLRVAVQLPGYTHQSQETSSFQQTNQSGGLMGVGEKEKSRDEVLSLSSDISSQRSHLLSSCHTHRQVNLTKVKLSPGSF